MRCTPWSPASSRRVVRPTDRGRVSITRLCVQSTAVTLLRNRAGSVASGDAARRQNAEAESTQPDSHRDRVDRDRSAADRSAPDRRVRRLALVRRTGLPVGVHHRPDDAADRVRRDRVAGRRHRVRRPGDGVSNSAGVRPEQRQRPGGALPHRGDVEAAGDRYRCARDDRPARRHCRADLLGSYSTLPARR